MGSPHCGCCFSCSLSAAFQETELESSCVGCTVLKLLVSEGLLGVKDLGGPLDLQRIPAEKCLPLKANVLPIREGKRQRPGAFPAALSAAGPVDASPGLEEQLLQRGLHARLQGPGIPWPPMAPLCLPSSQVSDPRVVASPAPVAPSCLPSSHGSDPRNKETLGRDVLGEGSQVEVALNLTLSIIDPFSDKETYIHLLYLQW